MDKRIDNNLETAFEISTKIIKSSIWDEKSCNWIGATNGSKQSSKQLIYESCDNSLSKGTSGIALFLANMYKFTDDPIVLRVLEGAISTTTHLLEKSSPAGSHGFNEGKLGIAFSLIRTGTICERQNWIDQGYSVMDTVITQDISPKHIDMTKEMLNSIVLLTEYYNQSKDGSVKQILLKLSEKLLENMASHESYRDFNYKSELALAFAELYEINENERCKKAALSLLKEEPFQFLPHKSSSLAPSEHSDTSGEISKIMINPTKAIAHLRCCEILKLQTLQETTEKQLQALVDWIGLHMNTQLVYTNFSLSSGLAGIGECLYFAYEILGKDSWKKSAFAIAQFGIDQYGRRDFDWPNPLTVVDHGNAMTPFIPGMFYGIAGIGQFYLRMAHPNKVGSILAPRL